MMIWQDNDGDGADGKDDNNDWPWCRSRGRCVPLWGDNGDDDGKLVARLAQIQPPALMYQSGLLWHELQPQPSEKLKPKHFRGKDRSLLVVGTYADSVPDILG